MSTGILLDSGPPGYQAQILGFKMFALVPVVGISKSLQTMFERSLHWEDQKDPCSWTTTPCNYRPFNLVQTVLL